MSMLHWASMQRDRNSTDCSESEPMLIMSSIERRRRLNFRIVSSGGERKRRDDRVHAAPVREARVDHRRRLVDAPADLRHDLVDDAAQVRLVREAHGRLVELAPALDPDVVGAVAHDLGDRVVREQALERPVAEDVVEDLRREALAVLAGDAGLVVQEPAHVRGHAVAGSLRSTAMLKLRPSSEMTLMCTRFFSSANGSCSLTGPRWLEIRS